MKFKISKPIFKNCLKVPLPVQAYQQFLLRLPIYSRLHFGTRKAHEVLRTWILPHYEILRIFSEQNKDTGLLNETSFVQQLSFYPFVYSQVSYVTSFLPATSVVFLVSKRVLLFVHICCMCFNGCNYICESVQVMKLFTVISLSRSYFPCQVQIFSSTHDFQISHSIIL